MMNVVISITPNFNDDLLKSTIQLLHFKIIQSTSCLICHISVNYGARDIMVLPNARIDVFYKIPHNKIRTTNQKLPTSGLFCKEASHIII